jgi:CHAT domain-containing protein
MTASDLRTQLKLDADWAVLSACNTAAEDKPGAEALSGLARAFFYAGARSLIVSHWSVSDEATARLVTGTFRASARDPKLSHAEALRQSMLAMIDGAKSDAEIPVLGAFRCRERASEATVRLLPSAAEVTRD